MSNLRMNEFGGVWCPKTNTEVDPRPGNMLGCAHCAYNKGLTQDDAGSVGVVCALVPKIRFCQRIFIHDNGSWACAREPNSLDEYRSLTGDLEASKVPEGFTLPRPTTFTRCILCAVQRRDHHVPNPSVPMEVVQEKITQLSSPASRAEYPPPISGPARMMRGTLTAMNPGWQDRCSELEKRLPKDPPQGPQERPTGLVDVEAPPDIH